MKRAHIYLEDGLLRSARQGTHNFIALLAAGLERRGLEVAFLNEDHVRPHDPAILDVFHMDGPRDRPALYFRRVYSYPFWTIETTPERWNWRVARATFDPDEVDTEEAEKFYRFWRRRLFGKEAIEAKRGGGIYVPLQGRLAEQRSFQRMSPLDMVAEVLAYANGRDVTVALHPKEQYSEIEREALSRLIDPVEKAVLKMGGMEGHLARCDFVVTQNSSAAFFAQFFGKPAILCGEIDFHHVMIKAGPQGLGAAMAQVGMHAPDYAKYVWWFWQHTSINAGREAAGDKIDAVLNRSCL